MPISETILVLMVLLSAGMLTAGLARKLPIPYTVLLVCIGIIISELSTYFPVMQPLTHFHLTPDLVLFILLPTLIFESGLNLNARQLVKDIGPVMALAVPALLFSTFFIGIGMWYLLSMDIFVALVFGALISATDPVAVVALFKELGTPERLTTLVEGESLLNDATAIVIFKILLGIALFGGMSWSEASEPLMEFLNVFIGGALIGVALGGLLSWIMSKLALGTSGILVFSLVLAYASFILAEHGLHLSGVMAVVGAALTLGIFGLPSVAQDTREALNETWEFLALISNTLLFLLMGLSVSLSSLWNYAPQILVAVALVLLARASMIYTLVPGTVKLFKIPHITRGEQHIMWWGGLKGGLAIAIVLSIPDSLPGKEMLSTVTLGVVMFTLLINAPSIRPLIKRLGLDKLSEHEQMELTQGVHNAARNVSLSLDELVQSRVISAAARTEVNRQLESLWSDEPDSLSDYQQQQQIKLNALHIEQETLNRLYKARIISGYTYADLRSEITRARDHIHHPARDALTAGLEKNPFIRLEFRLIRRLREKDWAASILAYYQDIRLRQHTAKYIAQILMTTAAARYVDEQTHLNQQVKQEMHAHYQQRLQWFYENIAGIKQDFPDFYHAFEIYLASRSALLAAKNDLEISGHHGFISAKPYNLLKRHLSDAFERIKPVKLQADQQQAIDMLSQLPLFSTLADDVMQKLSARMNPVHFLSQDIIIQEGDKGDALYLIQHGEVAVSHAGQDADKDIAVLGQGSFFGEMALLEDSIRTATVKAITPVTLFRLRRHDVLQLAAQYPAIQQRLQEAKQQRSVNDLN